jgi:hypothetical protein
MDPFTFRFWLQIYVIYPNVLHSGVEILSLERCMHVMGAHRYLMDILYYTATRAFRSSIYKYSIFNAIRNLLLESSFYCFDFMVLLKANGNNINVERAGNFP